MQEKEEKREKRAIASSLQNEPEYLHTSPARVYLRLLNSGEAKKGQRG